MPGIQMKSREYTICILDTDTAQMDTVQEKRRKHIYQLIEEENAGCRGSSLIEDVSDISLALTEPHGQKLGTLDGYEVGLALIGDGFSQQSFTCRRIKLIYKKN